MLGVFLCVYFAVRHGLIFVFWVQMGLILDSNGVWVGVGLVGLS